MAAAAVAATGVGSFTEQQEQRVPSPAGNHKRGREEETGAQTDKKWPGWPGDNVFRMMVPAQKVGAIIGRKGEFVKKMCEETRARIKILEAPPGTPERVVLVSAREEQDAALSPAMDGIMKVHKRLVDGGDAEGDNANGSGAFPALVSTHLLVAATQAGSLIGRQGSTIKSIQDASGAVVRVLPIEDLPICALADDRVVEIQGEKPKVQKALELVVSHLRKFLVDRTVLPLYEVNRTMASTQNLGPGSWGNAAEANRPNSSQTGIGRSYTPSTLPNDNFYPNFDHHLDKSSNHHGLSVYGRDPSSGVINSSLPSAPSHHGLSMYGRDPASGGLSSSLAPAPAAPVITQVSQQMQIPLSYADAIIGSAGANISYARRTSGATITIQETRGVAGEMTIEVHGTATQVQTAQQIIQNFMAGTSGTGSTAYNTADAGYNYNSHSSQNNYYANTPANNTTHPTGAYGSSYSSSYAY
eukprot:Gb_28050 [translate_table: standard]